MSAILFILYINDMDEALHDIDTISPCLGNKEIKMLLYADDAVIITKTVGGLRRALKGLETYCTKGKLTINESKTKIRKTGKEPRTREPCSINGKNIEYVSQFEYLGVWLSSDGKWKLHQQKMRDKASRALVQVKKYVYKYQKFSVKLLLHMFSTMVKPILMYGCEIWGICECKGMLDIFVNNFYKQVNGVSSSTPSCAMQLELGQVSIRYTSLQQSLNYFFRVTGGTKMLQKLCVEKHWTEEVDNNIKKLGITQILEPLDYNAVKSIISRRVYENWLKQTLNEIETKSSLNFYKTLPHYRNGAKYLAVDDRGVRKVYNDFRMFRFSWEIEKVEGERICVLCRESIESVEHLLVDCRGTEGAERESVLGLGLKNPIEILSSGCENSIQVIYSYLTFILRKRNERI